MTTTTNDDYRARLIEEVQSAQARQAASAMTDEELDNAICDSLGLPRGTQLTDEQLETLINYHRHRKAQL